MTQSAIYYLLEGFAVAFFGIMAVQNLWHRYERLRVILGAILLYWMAQHLVSVVFTSDFLSSSRDWSRIINAIDMTAEPTCCFLLIELCRPGWLTWRTGVANVAPFVALCGVFVATGQVIWYEVLIAFFVVYGVGVFVTTLVCIRRYNAFLRENYSYDENVNLRWLCYVLVTFFALMFVYVVCAMHDTAVGDCVYIVGSVASWAMICYFIQRQESVLSELRAADADKAAPPAPGRPQAQGVPAVDLEDVIRERFIERRIYLRPQLKLGDMAAAIGTNRTYLSRYLNETLHTTFYDYINALRIDYAIKMIEESEYGIQAIASIAGFNSYSTFRRTFIARHGCSPQEYRNRLG